MPFKPVTSWDWNEPGACPLVSGLVQEETFSKIVTSRYFSTRLVPERNGKFTCAKLSCEVVMLLPAGYVNWKPYFWFVKISWPEFTGGGTVAVNVGTGVNVAVAEAGTG